jgi:hypothetical protein
MCETLNNKIEWFNRVDDKENYEALEGITLKNLKEASKLYKKYRTSRYELMANRPEIYEKWINFKGIESYKDWFFDYCFKDLVD